MVTDVSSKYLIKEKTYSALCLVLNDLALTRVPTDSEKNLVEKTSKELRKILVD